MATQGQLKKTNIFVEAVPLVEQQMSGIPHALAGLVAALAANKTIQKRYEIILVAPKSRLHLLKRWEGLDTCTRRAIPMKFRIMNGLGRRGLLPKMDLLLGPGIYLFGNFFNWPLTKRSTSFTYIHDICFALYPQLVQPDNQRMLEKNVPRFIRQTDYVVAVSKTSKSEISQYFKIDPKKVVVVYNAANKVFKKDFTQRQVNQVRQKYKLSGKYFLFIGNIEPRKNIERLLNALMRLPKEYGLIMIGSDGWLNEKVFQLIDQAQKSGRNVVKPKHFVNDLEVAKLLKGAEALVLPSIYEGFGMPALEAISAEKIAVLSNIAQLKEVAGKAAVYCDPKNTESIHSALKQVISLTDKQRHEFIARAINQAKKFDWQQSAQKLVDIFESQLRLP